MLDWVKKFKEQGISQQTDDDSESRKIYAFPSKPFEMRQRDAKVNRLADGLRLLLGDTEGAKVFTDLSKGRILHDRQIIAERKAPNEPPSPKLEAIHKLKPGVTKEDIETKVAEATANWEKTRQRA